MRWSKADDNIKILRNNRFPRPSRSAHSIPTSLCFAAALPTVGRATDASHPWNHRGWRVDSRHDQIAIRYGNPGCTVHDPVCQLSCDPRRRGEGWVRNPENPRSPSCVNIISAPAARVRVDVIKRRSDPGAGWNISKPDEPSIMGFARQPAPGRR